VFVRPASPDSRNRGRGIHEYSIQIEQHTTTLYRSHLFMIIGTRKTF